MNKSENISFARRRLFNTASVVGLLNTSTIYLVVSSIVPPVKSRLYQLLVNCTMAKSGVLQNRSSTICLFIIFNGFLMYATVFAVEENSRSAKLATRVNKGLLSHVVSHFASPSLMSCSQSCLKSSWCTSTNFKESLKQGGKGNCELNKRENAPMGEDTELVDQPGVSFSKFFKVGSG